MVKVASCARCGKVVSAQWASVPECPSCGSDVREFEVDLQGRERIPKYLNRTGMALVAIVVLLFVMTMTDLVGVSEIVLLVLLGVCIIILFGSIIYQQRLVKESIEKAPEQMGRGRFTRRGRAAPAPQDGEGTRKGRLPIKRPVTTSSPAQQRPAKAVKIVQGRR